MGVCLTGGVPHHKVQFVATFAITRRKNEKKQPWEKKTFSSELLSEHETDTCKKEKKTAFTTTDM